MKRTYGRSIHTTAPLYAFSFQILPWRSHFEQLYGVKGFTTIPVSPQSSYMAYLYGTGYVFPPPPIAPSHPLRPSPSNSLTSCFE
ncbi:unnamed protein product [Tuber melanosporum]|uniref:(Perigord truffle) hypothetical protein n=1 Tax=Tuber melanosporum (strain Mel28) TaxID=656061 RepID=D5GPY5_TUBMM|nr:uncharacterized protein GSTUM_00012093001 [Tuber melanosporum]CAZ86578.1 unnamed protein product [Tuber melanosporum]